MVVICTAEVTIPHPESKGITPHRCSGTSHHVRSERPYSQETGTEMSSVHVESDHITPRVEEGMYPTSYNRFSGTPHHMRSERPYSAQKGEPWVSYARLRLPYHTKRRRGTPYRTAELRDGDGDVICTSKVTISHQQESKGGTPHHTTDSQEHHTICARSDHTVPRRGNHVKR